MKPPIVIIGIGELAGVFARAFLRNGHPVYPITRGMNMIAEAENLPDPQLVLVAVAEKDFPPVMETIPAPWCNHLVLLQNELLPRDWQAYDIENQTVISVWFEKKKGMDYKVLIPSRVHGPQARLIVDSLKSIDIPCKVLSGEDELLFELVFKNVFVLTINIAGLALPEGTTTETLWLEHNVLARSIASDVIEIQEWLTGTTFQREQLMDKIMEAVNGDPHHKCKGRAASGRLTRAISVADRAGLKIPAIRQIQAG